MVFPTGAYHMEFAADHLDRLLGKSILDRFVHKRGVTKDSHTSGTNQPQHGCKGGSPQSKRDSHDEKSSVKLRSRRAEEANVQVAALELADAVGATDDKEDDEEQGEVRDEGVDAQHDEHAEIVCREVAQVVVDARLGLGEVCRFGEALDVEELGDGTQVREARGERLRAHAGEAVAEAKPRSNSLDRKLDRGHVEVSKG